VSGQLIALLGGAAAFAIVVVVAVSRFEKRDTAAREAMWRALADRRGGRHHPGVWGRGGWRVSPVLELVVRGVRVRVDTFHTGASENTEVFTRAYAERAHGGPVFEVCIPGLVLTRGRVQLGENDGFDQDFAVCTDAPRAVAAAWNSASRALLRRYFHGMRARVIGDERGVTLQWHGEVREPEVIDAAIEIVADLARPQGSS
jgi:hypothetical protein